MKKVEEQRANEPVETSGDDAIQRAHRVLTYYLPGKSLPTDVRRLRAMLDAHMFGRDQRALRDDAVRAAWQIDSAPSSKAR